MSIWDDFEYSYIWDELLYERERQIGEDLRPVLRLPIEDDYYRYDIDPEDEDIEEEGSRIIYINYEL